MPVSPWLKSPLWLLDTVRSGVPVEPLGSKVAPTVRFWSMVNVQFGLEEVPFPLPEQVPPEKPPKLLVPDWEFELLKAGHGVVELPPWQKAYRLAEVPDG